MTDKLSPEERAVLEQLTAVGRTFSFAKDYVTADDLATRGLLERKRVHFANVPLFRLSKKAPAYMARHGHG